MDTVSLFCWFGLWVTDWACELLVTYYTRQKEMEEGEGNRKLNWVPQISFN